MKLMSTVLHSRARPCLVFHWKFSRMLTTPLRQLTSGGYQVERLCVGVLLIVCVGFAGLRNALPFRLPKQNALLLSGTL